MLLIFSFCRNEYDVNIFFIQIELLWCFVTCNMYVFCSWMKYSKGLSSQFSYLLCIIAFVVFSQTKRNPKTKKNHNSSNASSQFFFVILYSINKIVFASSVRMNFILGWKYLYSSPYVSRDSLLECVCVSECCYVAISNPTWIMLTHYICTQQILCNGVVNVLFSIELNA